MNENNPNSFNQTSFSRVMLKNGYRCILNVLISNSFTKVKNYEETTK